MGMMSIIIENKKHIKIFFDENYARRYPQEFFYTHDDLSLTMRARNLDFEKGIMG